jgi:hypothetical protein
VRLCCEGRGVGLAWGCVIRHCAEGSL